jgi:hypothetical protein
LPTYGATAPGGQAVGKEVGSLGTVQMKRYRAPP